MEFPGYFFPGSISNWHQQLNFCLSRPRKRMPSRGEDQWHAHFLITVDDHTKIDKEGVSALLRQVAEETRGDPDVNPLTKEDLTALHRDEARD